MKRFFCVQQHLASHRHYDLRLEHNGGLLSWAIPRGPSLNPTEKRMAVHVEDHPVEYGTFEGVIPEGYGAGIVLLWDYGTWKPEVDDLDAALRKGDVKFTLDGYKLKGSWVLVRTRDRSSSPGQRGRSWLLIKHRDFWSGPIDIATFAPRSVKSDGDLDDILADDLPDIWVSSRPARSGVTGALLTDAIQRATEKILKRRDEARVENPGTAGRRRRTNPQELRVDASHPRLRKERPSARNPGTKKRRPK